ncbi:MAG: HAMP domain-containing histidine kinase [Chloroflexi bacterium]|nr:HAMP domain-containing histidine kinase [Chloroflexota bacterium]
MIRLANTPELAKEVRVNVNMGVIAIPLPVNTPSLKLPVPQHELSVLATIAHELRGPLTALATSSELLAEDFLHLDSEQVKSMLDAMHRRTMWLQGLVENLLIAATIREGRLHLYRQSLSLSDVLADVDAVVSPLLAQRVQRLRVRFGRGVPEVLVDSRRLSQVLVNLILNASKFGANNSPIDLTITNQGDAVRLSVADRGPGVSSAHMHRLFEPYYRDPASAGSGKDGVGLGLSIVKSIVEAHGGQVGVESRPGGGARFWFTVPTISSTASAQAPQA